MRYPSFIATLLSLSLTTLQGQDTIYLQNPSFEGDAPECGKMPAYWLNGTDERLKDGPYIAPGCDFGAIDPAQGERYLCLKTHTGGITEQVAQRLGQGSRLNRDSLYKMSLLLAYAPDMIERKPNGKKGRPFDEPASLRIWGTNYTSDHKELLANTPLIDHNEWKTYDLMLRPQENTYDELLFEAISATRTGGSTNGNVLIDHISPIVRVAKEPTTGMAGASIALTNPSFEDPPRCCTPPTGWSNCNHPEESPTDIQPGLFQVFTIAFDGKTYLGMVVRDNNTTEAIGQRLPEMLQKGQRYLLTAIMARSKMLLSFSRVTGQDANFGEAAVLRAWGGNSMCEKSELLAESPLVDNYDWHKFQLTLAPSRADYRYILLESYYKTPLVVPYNGNLLLDNLSLQVIEN
ncbi:MAG: hypothetical protein ABMA02_09425 [Saprospiraceae bacterium]